MIVNHASNQYLATLSVNFIAIAYGVGCGWPSVTIPVFGSIHSPIGMQSTEVLSWMVSIMCIGGLMGTLFFGWITNILGRKLPLWFLSVPSTTSCILILFAQNAYYIYIARFLIGFVGGGAFVLIPVFIAEISEDHIRGLLSSALVFFCNIGALSAFIIGHFCSYKMASALYTIFPVLFCVSVYFLPETPVYLIRVNKIDEAEESLAYYRNKEKISQQTCEIYRTELEKLKNGESFMEKCENTLQTSDFTNRTARKALIISFGLVSLNQLCGCFAMINYTATIFKESGSALSPNMSAIIVGIIQLAGSCVSSFLVDRAGRKILISFSAFGTGFGLTILGLYSYCKMIELDVSMFSWVPVTSFSLVIFLASCGVLTLPFVVISEVLPEKIRPIGTSMCMSLLWVLAFLALKYFYWLSATLGMHGTMFLFAGFSFLGAIFVSVYVPETKGKSFDEIMKLL